MSEFFGGEFFLVDGTPCVDDVGQDKGNEKTDDSHGSEGKLRTAAVGYGERTLQVGRGRIVGSVVPTSA